MARYSKYYEKDIKKMIKMNKDRLDVSDVHHSKAQLYEVITGASFGNKETLRR